MKANV
jgi:hypothetical protein